MKKILLGLILAVLLFFLGNSRTLASCVSKGLLDACNPPKFSCSDNGRNYCCDGSANECIAGNTRCDSNLWCDCGPNGTGTKLKTAIGCIPVLDTKEAFLSFVLKWAVGVGGGIAFLLIIYAGFIIMTSAGNPERLKAGQELLTSAISGLILLIFSVVILKIIGVDILGLGKWGFGG